MTVHTQRNVASLVKRNVILKCRHESGQCRKNRVKIGPASSKRDLRWRPLHSPNDRLHGAAHRLKSPRSLCNRAGTPGSPIPTQCRKRPRPIATVLTKAESRTARGHAASCGCADSFRAIQCRPLATFTRQSPLASSSRSSLHRRLPPRPFGCACRPLSACPRP